MKYFVFIFGLLTNLTTPNRKEPNSLDFRNFYGICWRGTAHENLMYARSMGYTSVFYQEGMEKDSLSNGLTFYIESPEYYLYNRAIKLKKKYTSKEIKFYSNYCTQKCDTLPFPDNLATGWFFNDSTFSVELDYRKPSVIEWSINGILSKIRSIENVNPKFKFIGLAWDVPNFSGDFWDGNVKKGGKVVSLNYWTKNKIDDYSKGKRNYYRSLFKRVKKYYLNARFIIEPYRIYEDWEKSRAANHFFKKIKPDLILQESCGLEFILDRRIYSERLEKYRNIGSSTPFCFTHKMNLSIAGEASIKGATFGWFGRFGGTGDMPNYQSIQEVPARLKLIRMLPVWENLNKTPLSKRSWNGSLYKSSTAYVDNDIIVIDKPFEKKYYVVFLSDKALLNLPNNELINKVYLTDDFFQESKLLLSENVKSSEINELKNFYLNKGLILCYE